jgi:hypothetical protein
MAMKSAIPISIAGDTVRRNKRTELATSESGRLPRLRDFVSRRRVPINGVDRHLWRALLAARAALLGNFLPAERLMKGSP